MTISDEEVGKLWDKWYLPGRVHPIIDLIRKLVEERRVFKIGNCPSDHCASNHNDDALRDFGIDPASFTLE